MTTTPPPMPEALRLADCLDGNAMAAWTREDAAALLRAQHQRITALEAQKQELREALRLLRNYTAACEALLNVKPAGQIGIADTALENTND
jgi:hypothetical protein